MPQTTVSTNDKTIKEVRTDQYSLTYSTNEDDFMCAGCNTEKEGMHMEHSIFFKEFTDVAPMCMTCVNQHHHDFA